MKKIIGFKIYYGDGSVYNSHDGPWKNAPRRNVQVVILFEETKDDLGRPTRVLFNGDDFYFRYIDEDGREVWGSSFDDPSKIRGEVIYGKWLKPDEEYEKIRLRALEDYDI